MRASRAKGFAAGAMCGGARGDGRPAMRTDGRHGRAPALIFHLGHSKILHDRDRALGDDDVRLGKLLAVISELIEKPTVIRPENSASVPMPTIETTPPMTLPAAVIGTMSP